MHRGCRGVTPCWKSVHRISGYQRYLQDIRGIRNEYQEKIEKIQLNIKQISAENKKNLLDITKY